MQLFFTGERRIARTSFCRVIGAAVLICACAAAVAGASPAQELGGSQQQAQPGFMAVEVSVPQVFIEVKRPGQVNLSEPITLSVRSTYPEWSVQVEAGPLESPSGVIPPDRIFVMTDPAIPPQRLGRPVSVIVGDFRLPAREVAIRIGVRPEWTDRPAVYHGEIRMTGVALVNGEAVQTFADTLNLEVRVRDLMIVGISTDQVSFHAKTYGRMQGEPDVEVVVGTNTDNWEISWEATDLVGEGGVIPAERLSCEDLGHRHGGGLGGTGGGSLHGHGPQEPPTSVATLRFWLDIEMIDAPGRYEGEVKLRAASLP